MGLTVERQLPGHMHHGLRDEAGRNAHDGRSDLNDRCKRIGDPIIAAILLVMLAPLIALLLILVRLTSRGPALFKQVRLGKGGRPYHLYKIRTMTHDCERLTGPKWATAHDPRVTTLGRFLRRSHLDELPQIWNVIRGDMSLVGPRPERPEFVAKLEREITDYRERLEVRPGITGLAQVQLPPDEGIDDVRRKVICDLRYIQQRDTWLDIRIVLATAMKVAGVPFETTRRLLNLPGLDDATSNAEVNPSANSGSLHYLQST